MPHWNLAAAWIGFAVGVLAGALIGLRFADPDWLGGYASWPRRMLRLGHIACFGIGLINIAFAVTADRLPVGAFVMTPSMLLLVGAAGMPLVCWLSAWKQPARNLFPIPVLAVLVACIWTGWLVLEATL